jgi:hypothetical protein
MYALICAVLHVPIRHWDAKSRQGNRFLSQIMCRQIGNQLLSLEELALQTILSGVQSFFRFCGHYINWELRNLHKTLIFHMEPAALQKRRSWRV